MQFKRLTAYRVRRVAESILGLAEDLFARHLGIRALDWRVLVKLADAPGSTATEIGRDMLLTPVQTGRSLLKLRELEMVEAMPDPTDGRATRYLLTAAGRRSYELGTRIVLKVQSHVLRDFTPVEQVALDGLLDRLVACSEYGEEDVERLSDELFGRKGRHG
ncbi:MarR family winged helix-turn-helix transcriptional regulator [Achromobacter sp. Marseille-Q4962]|uniref:MarR family winged helix-turn-helix transcriptional regulator n=1 Tax=Achromobacter sp. Marseille-Q4962 TaxID=2942202 RepID=UPI00128EB932|nr:MarR family winged helix-turn-helix transcriptional regulator [Achromobacter sp. Marseille-Q4962]